MTSFDYCSDLHLEFDISCRDNQPNCSQHIDRLIEYLFCQSAGDNLIIAGDIIPFGDIGDCTLYLDKIKQFITSRYRNVIIVAGNHDYWGINYNDPTFSQYLKYAFGAEILDQSNPSVVVDDVVIVGSTLWTDIKPQHVLSALRSINDFKQMLNDGSNITVDDINTMHRRDLTSIIDAVDRYVDRNVVVVTHHSPVPDRSSDQYIHYNNLGNYIIDHPQIKVWVHGHDHQHHDYMIGNTRILSNPRGYQGYDIIANKFRMKSFEIL